jgi:hypothetical protein
MGFPLLALTPALAQGAGSILSNILSRKNRTPEYGDTAAGKFYTRMKSEGKYSPAARALMSGRVSSAASGAESGAVSRVRGYLASQGMGGSVAGASLLAQPSYERMRLTGDAERDIAIENEDSKVQAGEALARGETQFDEARRAEDSNRTSRLIGGLTGAVGTGINGYFAGKDRERADASRELATQWATEDRGFELDDRASDLIQRESDRKFMDVASQVRLLLEMGKQDEAESLYRKHFGDVPVPEGVE